MGSALEGDANQMMSLVLSNTGRLYFIYTTRTGEDRIRPWLSMAGWGRMKIFSLCMFHCPEILSGVAASPEAALPPGMEEGAGRSQI